METTHESQNLSADDSARGRSTVDFPYLDLDSGLEVANAVRQVGVTSCDQGSLATKLNMQPDGGGFRARLVGAKAFNLISYGRSSGGQVELTELAQNALDPQTEKRARFDAFCSIALYKTLFERLKGQQLPQTSALERLLESLGVAPKQKDKARQVFLRSAKQAGLFELAPDRLNTPLGLNGGGAVSKEQASSAQPLEAVSAKGEADHSMHPFVRGLIDKLPPPDAEWDLVSRAKWLTTAANIFDLMYSSSSQQGIKIRLEGSTLTISLGEIA
jgi:hypothetical protein